MQTIGERLEEARKRKGISIREASEGTKIRSEYLHKFESNSFDIGLPEIYVRGFLRNYSTYLRLNGDKMLADYRALAPSESRSSRREGREVYGRIDLGNAPRPNADAAATAAEGQAAPPAAERANFPSPAAGPLPIDPALLVKIGLGVAGAIVLVLVVVFGFRALSGKPSKPAPELKSVAEQTLTLAATGPVDVQVKRELDGQIIWRGHMEAGEHHSISRQGAVLLTATALENVQIDVNGKRQANPYSGYNRVQIP
jgi:transcriptional regulator with XRE-family HTH domain